MVESGPKDSMPGTGGLDTPHHDVPAMEESLGRPRAALQHNVGSRASAYLEPFFLLGGEGEIGQSKPLVSLGQLDFQSPPILARDFPPLYILPSPLAVRFGKIG